MKKRLFVLTVLISTALCGCSNKSNIESSATETTSVQTTTVEETEETTENNDYESEVIDILNSTSFMDSIDPSYVQYGLCSDITFGQLIASMFENYQLDILPTETTNTNTIIGYQITVSGNYKDTPNGYYINEGEAYITINLQNGTCSLDGDHYYKMAAENYAFSVTGFY